MTWKETDTDMKYRRLTGVMVSVAFLGLLTGCAGKESTEQRYAYPLGTASPEDTVTQIYAEKFAEEADRLSDGRIKITVYPNSVLGGDRELLESCYDGDIPFVVQNTAPQVNFIDDTAIFDAPCVFDDIEELRDKVDQPDARLAPEQSLQCLYVGTVIPERDAHRTRPAGAEGIERAHKGRLLADNRIAFVAENLAGKLDCLLTARNNDSFVTEGVPGGARSADSEDFPLAFGDCTPERLVAFGYAVLQGGG